MATIGTANAGKTFTQVAALEIILDDISDDQPEEAV